jgi:hypothetical protein
MKGEKGGNGRRQERVIPAEVTIENICYFTPSLYPLATQAKEKRISITRDDFEGEATVRISANVDYGLPITVDRDLYLAFSQILWEKWLETREIPRYVTFSTRRILRLCGRDRGDDWNRVKAWRRRLQATLITFDADLKTLDRMNLQPDSAWQIFASSHGTGDLGHDDEEAHVVQLSDWYRAHLAEWRVRPMDIEAEMACSSPIAKALSPILDFMFFARKSRSQGSPVVVRKRYEELAADFLLTIHTSRSLIERQFHKAHEQLLAVGKIRRWAIAPAKSGNGWVLEWECGPRLEEIDRIWTKEIHLPTPPTSRMAAIPLPNDQLMEPDKQANLLVRIFQEKKNKLKEYQPNSKECEQAKILIRRNGWDQAARIVDEAIPLMKKTSFDAQFFGAVMYLEQQALARIKDEHRAAEYAGRSKQQRQEEIETRQNALAELSRAFDALPEEERKCRLEAARGRCKGLGLMEKFGKAMNIDPARAQALKEFEEEKARSKTSGSR